MRKAILILGLLLRVASLVLLSLLAFLAWRAIRVEKSIQADADETHRVLLEAGLTASEARRASTEERAYLEKELPALNERAKLALDDTDALLRSLRGTSDALGQSAQSATGVLDSTRETLAGVAPILNQTRETIAGLEPVESAAAATITDADTLVKSPDIASTLHSVSQGTAELAATAKDVREEVHAVTHPKPIVSVINWILKIGGSLGGYFF